MARTDVREKLLTAGLEALHKRGFNGTGVQDITDAAKVPKGSFYNHFESKDALGVEVVERYAAKGAGRREPLMEGSGPPLTRLRTYFKALNQLGPATGFSRGCLLGNFGTELSAQSPAIRAALEAAFDDWTKAISAGDRRSSEGRGRLQGHPRRDARELSAQCLGRGRDALQG
jgi:TetR/AcrR family transcriptional repressor of nem operon